MIQVAVADDHQLVRVGIAEIVSKFDGYEVLFQAKNGQDLLDNLASNPILPTIILVDVTMPILDGFQTVKEISKKYPEIKCIALSVSDDYDTVFKMIEAGARGYLLKESSSEIILKTLKKVIFEGKDYDGFVLDSILKHSEESKNQQTKKFNMNEKLTIREMDFLKFSCSEMTYKEIADKMNVAPRTVDGYRESVFEKLNIKSRIGLVLFAMENQIVKLGK